MSEVFTLSTLFYTSMVAFSVVTLIVEIICIRSTSLPIAKWFENSFYLVIIAAISEWLVVVGRGFPVEAQGLLVMCKTIEMIISPIIPVSIALSVSRERIGIRHLIPLSVNALIVLANIFINRIFYFTANNVYVHGDLYFLYKIAYFLAIVYMFYKFARVAAKESSHERRILFIILSMLFIALVLQSIYQDLRIDWFVASLASALLCLNYTIKDQNNTVREMKKAMDEAKMASMAKTSFMGRMSHDLRTPINGIMGMVQIAEKNLDNKEVVADCLGKIDSSNRHLLSLISDILQMSSLESGAITLSHEKFDLKEIVEDCIGMLSTSAKDRGVRIFDDKAEAIVEPRVIGSPVHVKQILVNILSNSIKYNRIGGFVEMKTSVLSRTEDRITYRFTISDTGLGMSEEFVKKIFEPFSREEDPVSSKRPGSGLGMSIVKELVTLMGGSISVISEKNVGSVFTLDMPFEIDKEPVTEEKDEEYSFEGKRVLLVEDNDLNQEIAVYKLQEKGFLVDSASNGKEAVGKFLSSEPFYYDLILMDIMMPVMNGLEATVAIRNSERSDNNLPIIAMTANAYDEDKKMCLESGMDAHLSKPLEDKEMFSTIRSFLK